MKKIIPIILMVVILFSTAACAVSESSSQTTTSNITHINVRDFGAVGDGLTDDRQAIIDAFNEAKNNLPCEVYFPAGTYGISNGITVSMEHGTGGLFVRGAGRDITTIKYLETGYDPNVTGSGTHWYALRIWPAGMPAAKPLDEADYLYDISITGLTVYDPDPIAHAWNNCKGDPMGEETHGFDLHYVNRASVTDCNIITVGDEGIDICGCVDVFISNNHLVGSPAAGAAGGAISIGDDCKNVILSGNIITGSGTDEILESDVKVLSGTKLSTSATLPDGTHYTKSQQLSVDTVLPAGTVLHKTNFGIAVESLSRPISNVVITNNIVSNVHGKGVSLVATQDGASLNNITVSNNIIQRCDVGIGIGGKYPKSVIRICGNTISDCFGDDDGSGYGIYAGSYDDLTIQNNHFANINGVYAIRAIASAAKLMIYDNVFEDIAQQAIFCSGDVSIRNCEFNGIGTAGHLGSKPVISKYSGKLVVAGCNFTDVHSHSGIAGATVVENTEIEMVDEYGVPNAGGDVLKNIGDDENSLIRVVNCKFGARFIINRNNAIVQNVQITSQKIGSNAITINANGVLVSGCNIDIGNSNAITEGAGKNGNIFVNNITNRPISTVGADTISFNNIDLRNIETR